MFYISEYLSSLVLSTVNVLFSRGSFFAFYALFFFSRILDKLFSHGFCFREFLNWQLQDIVIAYEKVKKGGQKNHSKLSDKYKHVILLLKRYWMFEPERIHISYKHNEITHSDCVLHSIYPIISVWFLFSRISYKFAKNVKIKTTRKKARLQ